jgi:hypothetical protein
MIIIGKGINRYIANALIKNSHHVLSPKII